MQGNMMKSRPVLDPKKRREIITRIGDILEFQCRKCPYCFKNPEEYCQVALSSLAALGSAFLYVLAKRIE